MESPFGIQHLKLALIALVGMTVICQKIVIQGSQSRMGRMKPKESRSVQSRHGLDRLRGQSAQRELTTMNDLQSIQAVYADPQVDGMDDLPSHRIKNEPSAELEQAYAEVIASGDTAAQTWIRFLPALQQAL